MTSPRSTLFVLYFFNSGGEGGEGVGEGKVRCGEVIKLFSCSTQLSMKF